MDFPRIEYLKVENYRSLKNFELKDLTPLTVFLGPAECGKSTILDVFAFLCESFQDGLRPTWEKRGQFKEFRTHGSEEPILFEFRFRENNDAPVTTYHLKISEQGDGPNVD